MALALVEEPGAVNVMHGFYSEDLDTWTHWGIIAWGVASLGLAIDEDQSLLITAIQEVRPPTWWELRGDPPIRGYKYDGTTWHPKAWKIEDVETKAYIDPQIFDGQVWYISPTGTSGDPAKKKNLIPIRSSNPGKDRYLGYGLADPSPVYFNGELHLFATQDMHIVHAKGNPLRGVMTHPGKNDIFNFASVPFALSVGDELWLTAQANINGRRIPVLSKTKDALHWSRWKPIGNIPKAIRNCTSPVLGPHPKGGWLLLCIEEKRH
ncbi:MAG: hypothetical protein VX278_16230 [Myxococcota bacterium]|nr:hypothetical protein [Myxococcota bacterium]